ASVDKLVSYLDKDKLKIVRSEFCKFNAEDFDFLTRKGIFIERNIQFRMRAKNDFEKNLYKLMNDAVFAVFFAENLIAVEMRKLEVKFDKPIYVGMCIFDISKVCLYEIHHEYMRVNGKKDTKKAKGVKNNIIARTITFDDYTWCLNEEIEMTQSCIRSKLHQVYISVTARDSVLSERAVAVAIWAAMKAKTKMGMDMKSKKKTMRKKATKKRILPTAK
ncbi:hypothetical protein ALC53_08095, partial [Atta colombica]